MSFCYVLLCLVILRPPLHVAGFRVSFGILSQKINRGNDCLFLSCSVFRFWHLRGMSNLKARGTKVVALSNRSLNKSGALPFPLQGFMCLSTSPCEPRGSWPKSNISSNRKENKKHCQSRKGHQQNPEQAIENLEGIVRRHCLQYLAMLHLSVHVLSTMQKTN